LALELVDLLNIKHHYVRGRKSPNRHACREILYKGIRILKNLGNTAAEQALTFDVSLRMWLNRRSIIQCSSRIDFSYSTYFTLSILRSNALSQMSTLRGPLDSQAELKRGDSDLINTICSTIPSSLFPCILRFPFPVPSLSYLQKREDNPCFARYRGCWVFHRDSGYCANCHHYSEGESHRKTIERSMQQPQLAVAVFGSRLISSSPLLIPNGLYRYQRASV